MRFVQAVEEAGLRHKAAEACMAIYALSVKLSRLLLAACSLQCIPSKFDVLGKSPPHRHMPAHSTCHTHTRTHTHTQTDSPPACLPACLPAYLITYTDTHVHPWFRFLSLRFHSRSVNDRTGTLSSQRRRHTSEALNPSACESLVRPCIAGWP